MSVETISYLDLKEREDWAKKVISVPGGKAIDGGSTNLNLGSSGPPAKGAEGGLTGSDLFRAKPRVRRRVDTPGPNS